MPQLMDQAAFRQAEREGKRAPADGVFHVSVGTPKAYDDGTRRLRFCFSDSSVDRAGDTISAEGWVLDSFNKNPVALWAHDSSAPPIGRASNIAVENGRLMGDIEFAPPETYAFADTVYRLVKDGYINAVSVGFLPKEYAFVDNDADRPWGIDFKRQELLEISIVPVPCNANALMDARAKGIDPGPLLGWAERLLKSTGSLAVPRAELEALLKSAEGMSESDPASGGAAVGSCGRKAEDECGMKDPQECSVHRSEGAMDEKKLADLIGKAVAGGIATGVAAALKATAPRARRRAEGDDPEQDDNKPSADKAMRKALGVTRAMSDLSDDISDAADQLQAVVDTLTEVADDATDPAADGDAAPAEDPEEKAARQARVRALRRRLAGQ